MRINNATVTKLAKSLGFDLVGFAKVELLKEETERLKKWLENGFHAGMAYMEKNGEKRLDVRKILPDARSIISLGMNYYIPEKFEGKAGTGKVSRYAWGKDYHLIIWEKMEELIESLKEIDNKFKAKGYVDTGPVLDRAWAVRAGLGWIGKNSNVINTRFGSWFFIANIITNYDFDFTEVQTDMCGTCTACIDACPTNAITNERTIDSNKCISYLTIENKGEIPKEFHGKMQNWVFGCDICQEVCPWNKKFAQTTRVSDFHDTPNKELNLEEILELTNSKFNKRFALSPIKRARAKGLKRNARFLLEEKQEKKG
jgi:epoxyqueuosine reductase